MSRLRPGLRVYAKHGVITSDGGSGEFRMSAGLCFRACMLALLAKLPDRSASGCFSFRGWSLQECC